MISSVMIAVFASLLALAITWQEYYDYAFQEFLDNDPDDWAGREADYRIDLRTNMRASMLTND